MNKRNGLLAGCLGLGMILMGCDSSTGTSGTTVSEAALIGKWSITSVHTKGWETDNLGNKKDVDSTETFPVGVNTVEYKSDHSYSTGMGGLNLGGTWSVKGDSVITVTSFLGLEIPSSVSASISGNSGTFISHQVDTEEDLVVTTTATK